MSEIYGSSLRNRLFEVYCLSLKCAFFSLTNTWFESQKHPQYGKYRPINTEFEVSEIPVLSLGIQALCLRYYAVWVSRAVWLGPRFGGLSLRNIWFGPQDGSFESQEHVA